MKDTTFLTSNYYVYKGIYDNKNVYENTLESIKVALRKNLNLYLTIAETKDGKYALIDQDTLENLLNQKDNIEDTLYSDLEYLSFYHVPLLEEVLSLTKNTNLLIHLKIKNYKNKEIFNILDKYPGKFGIVSGNYKTINWLNKNRENYIVGEIVTHHKSINLNFYFAKTDFKTYNIEYYDKIKISSLINDEKVVLGYLINSKTKYDTYKDTFTNLIIDNYLNVVRNI